MSKKRTASLIAAAVGALFATSSIAVADESATEGNVKCFGSNACKGNSACKTASNGCKGQNACKGQGYEMLATEKECTDKGGKVEK